MYRMSVNPPFTLLARLLANSQLLVPKFLGSQSYGYTPILDWEEGSVPLMSVLFKGRL